jgi:hypothetical protein
MSDRKKPHNGRDKSGHFKVKRADVDDLPEKFIRDDVRLGGAVADVGIHAGERAERISELVDENRENVAKVTRKSRGASKGRSTGK